MKVFIICALVAAAQAGVILNNPLLGTGISTNHRSEDGIGNYAFGYNEAHPTGGTFRKEVGDALGNKVGSYGLAVGDGRVRTVNYVADGLGFRANVQTNEPGVEPKDPAAVLINKTPIAVSSPLLSNIGAVKTVSPLLSNIGAYGAVSPLLSNIGAYGAVSPLVSNIGAYGAVSPLVSNIGAIGLRADSIIPGIPTTIPGIPTTIPGIPTTISGIPTAIAGIPSTISGLTFPSIPTTIGGIQIPNLIKPTLLNNLNLAALGIKNFY